MREGPLFIVGLPGSSVSRIAATVAALADRALVVEPFADAPTVAMCGFTGGIQRAMLAMHADRNGWVDETKRALVELMDTFDYGNSVVVYVSTTQSWAIEAALGSAARTVFVIRDPLESLRMARHIGFHRTQTRDVAQHFSRLFEAFEAADDLDRLTHNDIAYDLVREFDRVFDLDYDDGCDLHLSLDRKDLSGEEIRIIESEPAYAKAKEMGII